ncbi:MAG: PEP-CTERM sorting domain-containing protein [Terrimicrobiaceae bacterium]
MKKLLLLLSFSVCSLTLQGQTLISDFSNIAVQAFDPFNGNWNGGSPAANQYIQNTGFIVIAPVNGGDPKGDGSFDASLAGTTPISFASITQLSLTARVDSGNQATSVEVQIRDSAFTVIGSATFATSLFTSSFSTVSAPFVLGGGGTITDATYFRMAGDGVAANSVRVSFDNLAAVPEPSTIALAVLGLIGVTAARRRR